MHAVVRALPPVVNFQRVPVLCLLVSARLSTNRSAQLREFSETTYYRPLTLSGDKIRYEWSYCGTYGRKYTNLVGKDVNRAIVCSQISRNNKRGQLELHCYRINRFPRIISNPDHHTNAAVPGI
jgi:hypothetical protein